MLRISIVILSCISMGGCAALAQMQEQQAEQQQEIQNRLAALTSEQRDAVERCSSETIGRMNTLRLAQQAASEQGESPATRLNQQSMDESVRSLTGAEGADEYTAISQCLDNPYYYETIPSPPAINVQSPPVGGQSLWEQCLEAQAAGAAVCN